MHHHHIDEFSVTDIRHTLGEVWRVVRDRRWWFLLPFLSISTIALVCSFRLPRTWTVSTVIRREHDPVLASMMGRSWTEPYAEIRQRMAGDLADPEMIEKVLTNLNLPKADHFPNGEPTPASVEARRNMVGEIAAGLSTKSLEASANRDVVSIRLTLSEAQSATEILRALRDAYIARAQKRTTEILRSVEGFFQGESARCRAEAAELQKQLNEIELAHPGVNPDAADPTQAAHTALVVENVQIGRQLDELRTTRPQLEADLADALTRPEADTEADAGGTPNPKYKALSDEIAKLKADIVEGQTIKMMTVQHPTMQRLLSTLESKQAELDAIPATMESAQARHGLTAAQRLGRKIEESDAKSAALEKQLADNKERINRIEQGRAAMLEHRDTYLKTREKLTRVNEEAGTWKANLGPIKHILTLEDSNRGIHFATVRDAEAAVRPTTPDAKVVVGMCLAIGAALAAVLVLITELLDRSFRTAHGLSTTLGIPVIESIDEILSAAARKKRTIRRVILMPATAAVLSITMMIVGALAYTSLDCPTDYHAICQSPSRFFSVLLGS